MTRPELRTLAAAVVLMVLLLPACAPAPAPDRKSFATPDEAAKALLKGIKANNTEELKAIFGPNVEKDLSSGDPVSDRHDRDVIALAMGQSWRWAPVGSDRQELVIGDEQWPFPVPLTKVRGGWQFDTAAGADEMLSRRIGRNELRVIDVCRDYVAMQKAYASQPRDGKLAGLYAQKFPSSPGRQDGLYWRVGAEETPSPLGDQRPGGGQGGRSLLRPLGFPQVAVREGGVHPELAGGVPELPRDVDPRPPLEHQGMER